MLGRFNAVFGACLLALSAIVAVTPASAQFWQCAPFAREVSGIDLYGNAGTWWAQADGRYERGHSPAVGSVMVIKPSHGMRVGHVAMVSRVVSDREVLVTHANWSRRGGVERDVRVVDVSANGDWSQVKVWYAANRDLGTSSYPVYGFIYAKGTPAEAEAPSIQIASRSSGMTRALR
ncbi:MAG: CHAP domain-containing protein [Sphingomonas sanxanigenens]|uniref:CHAP domain-containing protein n=1 Tax=Sphingomonas sanxanigenens TaxID=397260 RepID=A0A2W5C2D2_9SPHN|nr:MAG: CHAP domain-containing protein [Sphingomonas sanxanigenens]